jgi:hypothetical protein
MICYHNAVQVQVFDMMYMICLANMVGQRGVPTKMEWRSLATAGWA